MDVISKQWNSSRQVVGLTFLGCVIILWVSSSEITQTILKNQNFDRPFFLTYFNVSFFAIYMPFFSRLFYHSCQFPQTKKFSDDSSTPSYTKLSTNEDSLDSEDENANINTNTNANGSVDGLGIEEKSSVELITLNLDNSKNDNICSDCACCTADLDPPKLSLQGTVRLSAIFCPIWFIMSYSFNASLKKTSVSSNTIISSMSGPFSLLFSRLILSNPVSCFNFTGVFVTLLGSILIGYLDQTATDNSSDTAWGNALAFISAFVYAIYVTMIKYVIGDDSRVNMYLFFGLIGVLNVLCLTPFLWILDAMSWESLSWPKGSTLVWLTMNAIISALSDYCWAQSILLTSPVVATVGLSMMMPFAMIADQFFRGQTHSLPYWLAACCVMTGFVLVNVDYNQSTQNPKDIGCTNGNMQQNGPTNFGGRAMEETLIRHTRISATFVDECEGLSIQGQLSLVHSESSN